MQIRPLFMVLMMALVKMSLVSCGAAQNTPGIPRPGTLQWHAQQAKSKGKASAEIVEFPGLSDQSNLDEAVERYTVVTAIPIASAVQPETGTILTWHKFRVVSVLSKASKCEPCDPAPNIPPRLLPLLPSEIAVPLEGGTARVDGVTITVRAAAPRLEMNQLYLLFLRGAAGSNQVAELGGETLKWVFKVDKHGKLFAVSNRTSPLSRDVMSIGASDLIHEHIQYFKARQHGSK